MNIPILYEDGDVLAVNKPAGLVVHFDGKTDEPTLSDWIRERYPQMSGVGEPLRLSDGAIIDRPGIVHRIDRETSGALLIAKHQDAFLFLKKQFQSRQVAKTYVAFVYGSLKEGEGSIDWPIGKSVRDFRLRVAVDPRLPQKRQARGSLREALTEYRVLKRGTEAAYIEAKPKTGRTHQLRVHFKALRHPIVCDKLYAPKRDCVLGFDRLALHARSLTFMLPSNKTIAIEAPPPEDFEQALGQLN